MRATGIHVKRLIALALLGLVPATAFAAGQATSPTPKSFATAHSVVVIGPNSPIFDSVLEKDFPGASGVKCFNTVEPLLAIVHNNTRRVIKAYVVKWTITNADGTTAKTYLNGLNKSLDLWEITGQRAVMGPAGTGTQLVSPFFRWSKERFPTLLAGEAVIATFCALAQQVPVVQEPLVFEAQAAESVHATVDGVIFGDGVFVGPDTSKLYERFEAAQKAEVDEGAWVLSQINSGVTDQELRSELSTQIYTGRNATGMDNTSLYTAARGREATRLLGALNQLSPTGFRGVVVQLAAQKLLTLSRQLSP